jgi:hypothetical protein
VIHRYLLVRVLVVLLDHSVRQGTKGARSGRGFFGEWGISSPVEMMACGFRLAVARQTTRSGESSGQYGEAPGCSKSVPFQTLRVMSSPADAADPSRLRGLFVENQRPKCAPSVPFLLGRS